MNENESNNDQPLKSHGLILDPEHYDEDMKPVTDFLTKMEMRFNGELIGIQDPPIIKIRLVFNYEANAVADKFHSDYYIGLYMGTFFVVRDVFFRMLSFSEILPQFGDPSKEVRFAKVEDVRYPNFMIMVRLNGLKDAPRDVMRYLVAQEMMYSVLTWVLHHELAHIMLGHVDYGKSHLGINDFIEDDTSQPLKARMDPIFRQVCELDADALAVIRSMKHLLKICEVDNEHLRTIFPSIKDAVYLWMFSVYSYWKIVGGELPRVFRLYHNTHPSPETRQFGVFLNIEDFFDNYYKDNLEKEKLVDEIMEAAMKGVNESELAFTIISEQENFGSIEMFRSEIIQYFKIMEQEFSTVRNLIKPFSKLPFFN